MSIKKILIPIPTYGFDLTEMAISWKILFNNNFVNFGCILKNRRNISKIKDCSPRLRRGFGGQVRQPLCNLKLKRHTIARFSCTYCAP